MVCIPKRQIHLSAIFVGKTGVISSDESSKSRGKMHERAHIVHDSLGQSIVTHLVTHLLRPHGGPISISPRAEGHLFAGNDQVFNQYFWKGTIQNRTS